MYIKALFRVLVENPTLQLLGAIILPVFVWKLKQHISRHREMGAYGQDIHQLCQSEYLETADTRRDFQNEIDDLGQSLKAYVRQTPIKNPRLRSTAWKTIGACDDVAETWIISGVSGDLDTTSTHGINDVETELPEQVAMTKDVARQLQREVRISFVLGPVINIAYSIRNVLPSPK